MPENLNSYTIKPLIAVDTTGDKTNGSNISCRDPTCHGPGVSDQDLARAGILVGAGLQNIFPGYIPAGAMLYGARGLGMNGQLVLGLANAIRSGNQESGASGGQDLMSGGIKHLIDQKVPINPPPKIVSQESDRSDGDNPTMVRVIQEIGQEFSLSLLDGLPNHGALYGMSGFRTPETKKVPTARQTNDQMMTNNMFDQLQGQIMSIGKMLSQLQSNGSGGGGGSANSGGGLGTGQSYWQDIHDVLTPNMSTALTSLSNLIQSHETDNGVGYVTGGVVHTGIYLENAASLLAQATNIDDLMTVFQRLQWDTSIMGHEALDNVVVQIENAWGVALQEVDHNGTITVTYADANAQIEFANSMSNTAYAGAGTSAPASSGGGGGGGSGSGGSGGGMGGMGNMFGTASQTIQDMWKRLATTQEQTATQLHKKLNQQQVAQTQNQINKGTINGQDITQMVQQLFSQ